MKKIILFSFVSLFSLSSESFSMQTELQEIPSGNSMHPAFARYHATGYWGDDAFQYDHLGDLYSGKKCKKSGHPLSNTRGSTFLFEGTSDRIPPEQRPYLTQEMIDESFNYYLTDGNWGNNFSRQSHNSDLLSGKNEHMKSTRGETFYIHSTSTRK